MQDGAVDRSDWTVLPDISQGSVATCLRCGGIFYHYFKFMDEFCGEKTLTICEHFVKVTNKSRSVPSLTPVTN